MIEATETYLKETSNFSEESWNKAKREIEQFESRVMEFSSSEEAVMWAAGAFAIVLIASLTAAAVLLVGFTFGGPALVGAVLMWVALLGVGISTGLVGYAGLYTGFSHTLGLDATTAPSDKGFLDKFLDKTGVTTFLVLVVRIGIVRAALLKR